MTLFYSAYRWPAAGCEGVILSSPFSHKVQKISLEITFLYVLLLRETHLDALYCVPAGLLVAMLIAGVQHHSDTSLPPPTRA